MAPECPSTFLNFFIVINNLYHKGIANKKDFSGKVMSDTTDQAVIIFNYMRVLKQGWGKG
jgi:hypothetical protein